MTILSPTLFKCIVNHFQLCVTISFSAQCYIACLHNIRLLYCTVIHYITLLFYTNTLCNIIIQYSIHKWSLCNELITFSLFQLCLWQSAVTDPVEVLFGWQPLQKMELSVLPWQETSCQNSMRIIEEAGAFDENFLVSLSCFMPLIISLRVFSLLTAIKFLSGIWLLYVFLFCAVDGSVLVGLNSN